MATKKKMPKVEVSQDSMDILLEQVNKVKDEMINDKNKPETSMTNIQKLRSKIEALEEKEDKWAYIDATIGEIKAFRRGLTGEKGRKASLPGSLVTSEVAPYMIVFLSVIIKDLRKLRNSIVAK